MRMLLDEARLAAAIRHANVVSTLDVVEQAGELFVVMEYVHGAALSRLLSLAELPVPPAVAVAIVTGALHGLHAAHEAKDEEGRPLEIVHRDVSPENVLVGTDGSARLLDFGVAKAASRLHTTRDGSIKGKLRYMAPEQLARRKVTRQTDVFAASAICWELLTGEKLFTGETDAEIVGAVLEAPIAAPSQVRPSVPMALDAIVLRGLSRDTTRRFSTARELALALAEACPPAGAAEVGLWVEGLASAELAKRQSRIADLEKAPLRADTLSATVTAYVPAPPRSRRVGVVVSGVAVSFAIAAGVVWLRGAPTGAVRSANAAPVTDLQPIASELPQEVAASSPPLAPLAPPLVPRTQAPVPRAKAAPAKTRSAAGVATTARSDCYELGPDGEPRLRRACMK